ncbi:MAG: hypothetical protein P1U30_10370, partial [Phycisphaerales bacterium]|nr:hypothetical protein [Phycisphaerales bacterium]
SSTQDPTQHPDWNRAAKAARKTIDTLLQTGLPNQHEVLSINIPATQYLNDNTKAVVCPMNTHALVDQYEQRATPKNNAYYWSTAHGLEFRSTDQGTDVHELFERNITITPLSYDLTNHNRLAFWNDRINNTSKTPEQSGVQKSFRIDSLRQSRPPLQASLEDQTTTHQ